MLLALITRWPLPALWSWAAAWCVFHALQRADLAPAAALIAAGALAGALALLHPERWRRAIVAAGFPLSLLLIAPGLPAWMWLLPLALLVLVYPHRNWRDAPLFPTPADALQGLADLAPLPDGARVLDAGCGLGSGLRELRRAYPRARLEGIEFSAPLAGLARMRCPWAHIARGDLWAQDWAPFDLVYVFQRPESMERVWAKAQAELRPGAWLVSLDFAVPGRAPVAQWQLSRGHSLWLYKPANMRMMDAHMERSTANAAGQTQASGDGADMG